MEALGCCLHLPLVIINAHTPILMAAPIHLSTVPVIPLQREIIKATIFSHHLLQEFQSSLMTTLKSTIIASGAKGIIRLHSIGDFKFLMKSWEEVTRTVTYVPGDQFTTNFLIGVVDSLQLLDQVRQQVFW